ncbi:MAG: putative Ig domain-containing protein [Planctomycetaceae bacterium]
MTKNFWRNGFSFSLSSSTRRRRSRRRRIDAQAAQVISEVLEGRQLLTGNLVGAEVGDALLLNAGGGAVGDFVPAADCHDRAVLIDPRFAYHIRDVPEDVPEDVFQSYAQSPRRLGDLKFDIATDVGVEYQVDLLFAETWWRAFKPGVRVFDVAIDGEQVLNDFDIAAEAGAVRALVKTFTVTGDGNLDIDLSAVKNNPAISGVMVTRVGETTNRPPVLSNIANQTATTSTLVQFDAMATDPDNDALTYSLVTTGLPGSPAINATTGRFTWTPPAAGTFNVEVRVSDGSLTDSQTFSVTVADPTQNNTPPVLSSIPSQQATVGNPVTFTAVATDADSDTLTFSLSSAAPTGATINATTGAFTWTPTAAQVGSVAFPVFVTDGTDQVARTVNVTVSAATGNQAPVLAAVPSQTATVGQLLTFTASATDADLPPDTLTYFLDPTAPTGATIDATTGVFRWTPAASEAGPISFPIFVSDGTVTVSQTVTGIVEVGGSTGSNQSPSFGPQDDFNVAATATLAVSITADDPNAGDTLTYSLVTTNLPGTATVNPSTGLFTFIPPASAANSSFTVTIRATDSGGLTDDAVFTVNVQSVGTGGGSGNQAPVLADIPNQQATVGTLLSFTVMGADADGDSLTYFLDPTGPFLANISSAGVFTWTPTAADVGTRTFPIFVDDGTTNTSKPVTIVVSA